MFVFFSIRSYFLSLSLRLFFRLLLFHFFFVFCHHRDGKKIGRKKNWRKSYSNLHFMHPLRRSQLYAILSWESIFSSPLCRFSFAFDPKTISTVIYYCFLIAAKPRNWRALNSYSIGNTAQNTTFFDIFTRQTGKSDRTFAAMHFDFGLGNSVVLLALSAKAFFSGVSATAAAALIIIRQYESVLVCRICTFSFVVWLRDR